MSDCIQELNVEMDNKIKQIENLTPHDEVIINYDKSDWKNILMIYTVITNEEIEQEVISLDNTKVESIKRIFWDFHSIDYKVKIEQNAKLENKHLKQKRVLYINISKKSIEEIMNQYGFNQKQREQISELSKEKYNSLWLGTIYSLSTETPNIVQIALLEVGNVGGQKYWSWYGFTKRVEWCAIFISWIANEAGLIENNIIPKFSVVQAGIHWFKTKGLWKNNAYIPHSGDIIFFDWESDGIANHVGLVEKVENNTVFTIEGNSNDDTCRQKQYNINSNVIFGYGILS